MLQMKKQLANQMAKVTESYFSELQAWLSVISAIRCCVSWDKHTGRNTVSALLLLPNWHSVSSIVL